MSVFTRTAARAATIGVLLAAGAGSASHEVGPEPGHAEARPIVAAFGPPAPSATTPVRREVGAPTAVVIPAIGVDEPLVPVGLLPDGAMQTPEFGAAGWYRLGPPPGSSGPAVLVAHVHGPAGDDVFARLHELQPGDRIVVARRDGSSTFVVESVQRVPKDRLPYARVWSDDSEPVLRLITCGGTPDPATRTYPDNTIVYARLGR